jgi:hypothetical protein
MQFDSIVRNRRADKTCAFRASVLDDDSTMLVVARDRVQKLKAAGKSADEIVASKPLANLDSAWSGMLGS